MSMAYESATKSTSVETIPNPDHQTIAELAYQLWILRAQPIGSPEVDWHRAEEELKFCQQSG